MPRKYYVYVIRLDPRVARLRRFQARNPAMQGGKPCVYVGSSAHTPEERFARHMDGIASSRWVRDYGVKLHEKLTRRQPVYTSRIDAEYAEYALAMRLRERGYGVWTNLPVVPHFYRTTQFRVPGTPDAPGMPGAPDTRRWPARFALVTGYATTGEAWTDVQNKEANRRLRKHLERRGIWHWPVTGYSPATGHEEPGWAVALDLEAACELGRRFRQDAVYWIEDDVLYVSFCDERRGKHRVAESFTERVSYMPKRSACVPAPSCEHDFAGL